MLNRTLLYHEQCRAGGGQLRDFLDLGELYPSRFLLPGETPPPRLPLTLAVAEDSELVQLRHTADPDLLFRHYWYHSGTNETMQAHLRELVDTIRARVRLKADDLVLDIGCNDGTLLSAYDESLTRVGFDPARLQPEGVDLFVNDYFSARGYGTLPRARVVTSIAMFYDLEEPVHFAQEVAQVLAEDGLWVIEMHYLPAMLAMNSLDAICHEHLAYYTLGSLEYVLDQAGLYVQEVTFNSANGGSFRAYVRRQGCGQASRGVAQARASEQDRLDFGRFAENVLRNKAQTLMLLHDLKAQGKRVLGYGASTKGNTLLQYYGLDPDLLPAIADRQPEKWGRLTVGSQIPIISEAEARALRPDYFFVLPYHFLPGFLQRERAFLNQGGQFIVPMSQVRIVP